MLLLCHCYYTWITNIFIALNIDWSLSPHFVHFSNYRSYDLYCIHYPRAFHLDISIKSMQFYLNIRSFLILCITRCDCRCLNTFGILQVFLEIYHLNGVPVSSCIISTILSSVRVPYTLESPGFLLLYTNFFTVCVHVMQP